MAEAVFGGNENMIRKILAILLIIFMYPAMVLGYPYVPHMEGTTVPLDPIDVNSTLPYLMKVPSGDQLHLIFHFNGTEGNGSFTLALFQVENATVPDHPDFPEYGKMVSEGKDYQTRSNFTLRIRTATRYLSSVNSSLQVVKVESGEDLQGISFDTFYEASIGMRQFYPAPSINENKSEALLAIYFEGQGNGRINFMDYHLVRSLVLRGGDEFDTSGFAASWLFLPSLLSFIVLLVMERRRLLE
ncbi:MAG: hypothetical protein D6732_28715 [Methanobacteriota archaeon]|nr:MAG: hypothetical protein D6732_28715 [Euryarchaeota archaeon]